MSRITRLWRDQSSINILLFFYMKINNLRSEKNAIKAHTLFKEFYHADFNIFNSLEFACTVFQSVVERCFAADNNIGRWIKYKNKLNGFPSDDLLRNPLTNRPLIIRPNGKPLLGGTHVKN